LADIKSSHVTIRGNIRCQCAVVSIFYDEIILHNDIFFRGIFIIHTSIHIHVNVALVALVAATIYKLNLSGIIAFSIDIRDYQWINYFWNWNSIFNQFELITIDIIPYSSSGCVTTWTIVFKNRV
jgi:hypothetical protein